MKVGTIVARKGSEICTISTHARLKTAANVMHSWYLSALVVVKDRKVVGVISERDIVAALARHEQMAGAIHFGGMLSLQLVSITIGGATRHAMSVTTHGNVWHLPVVDDGALMHNVNVGNIVKRCVEEIALQSGVRRDGYISNDKTVGGCHNIGSSRTPPPFNRFPLTLDWAARMQ